MKKTLFIFIAVLLYAAGAGAQNWEEIISSDKYYYGEGFSDTYDKAKNMALQKKQKLQKIQTKENMMF